MSVAGVAGGLGALGAVTGAIGQVEAGYAGSNAATYQAAVAKNNEQIALQNATEASEAGVAQAGIVSLKSAERVGAVRAGQAAGGVSVDSGSAVDVRTSQREAGQLDAETVLHNAELVNYGYRAKATGFEAESELDTMKAEQLREGGLIGGAAGLIGSASGIGFRFGGNPANPGGTTPAANMPTATGDW
jgi:hypothetical protein